MKHRLNNMIFVHYGRNELNIEDFYNPPQILDSTKPEYGLWGCPISPLYFRLVDIPVSLAKSGLRMYMCNPCLVQAARCIHNGFLNRGSVKFRLSPKADILIIENEKDIKPYCEMSDFRKTLIDMGFTNKEGYEITRDKTTTIDFDLIKEVGYDGMFVFHNKNELDGTILYKWETDSLVVWNPDVIRIVK